MQMVINTKACGKDNLQSGMGTFTASDGTEYNGDWVNGKRHGNGYIQYPDGGMY